MKFYPRDWRGDQALRVVSLSARGLWIEMLCAMHEASPYGHLLVGGQPVSDAALARLVGTNVEEVQALLVELGDAGVFRRTRGGVIYSKRMTDDHKRSVAGRKAKETALREVSENAEENPAPSRPPSRPPTTQKPESRRQNKEEDADASFVAGKPDDVRTAFDEWNALAERCGLPKAKLLDDGRRKAIRSRLAAGGLAAWRSALAEVERSSHCRGENDRHWRADLDFVCQPKSWRRLLEGSYTGGEAATAGAASLAAIPKFPNAAIRAYVVDHKSEGWAVSFLDTCAYAEAPDGRTITAPNSFVAGKLRADVPALEQRGIRILVQTEAMPRSVA
jgi:hypothetical protein